LALAVLLGLVAVAGTATVQGRWPQLASIPLVANPIGQPPASEEASAALPEFESSLPIKTLEEAAELAEQCAATGKAIYAFLAKHVSRKDEEKVLAEYRHEFGATVSGLYLDLLAGGMTPPDRLAGPVLSLTDIQWTAHILTDRGEGYRLERLKQLSARAAKEIQEREDKRE
jgi:hypothetical protein